MLKNAPMFKKLDAKIKVYFLNAMPNDMSDNQTHVCFKNVEGNNILSTWSMQGKSSSLGVGRGRAMRGKVSSPSPKSSLYLIYILRIQCLEIQGN